MLDSIDLKDLSVPYGIDPAVLEGRPLVQRRLSDLDGCFADEAARAAALEEEDALVYAVSSVEPADGEGQLHYGLGILHPGKVGREYYLTKGHLHAHRAAAEVYIGLSGRGEMLLEDEAGEVARRCPLGAGRIVYVPGFTAHRTVNTGPEPLVYIGVYPSSAGHDYGAIAGRNFRHVLVEEAGKPVLLKREAFFNTN